MERPCAPDAHLGPLTGKPFWFVPIAPAGPAALTGSVCLLGSQPSDEVHHPSGRIERVPPPFNTAGTVLVFEDPDDASEYFHAYIQDDEGRIETLSIDHNTFSIARMTPQQVADNFRQSRPGALWHVPVPVHHEWAGEVVEELRGRGIPPSTTIATTRLAEYQARGYS
jgi:hypothetical protein